jgi:hypothetical protein
MEPAENFGRTTRPEPWPSPVTGIPPPTLGQPTVAVGHAAWYETAQFAPRLS